MSKRSFAARFLVAAFAVFPVAGVAQKWVPGAELIDQSVVIETEGTTNTVHFDARGAARIVSPNGRVVTASWTATDENLCLSSAGSTECWPYREAFQAGRQVTLTSDCRAVSSWLPNGTNAPPVKDETQKRG